MVDLIAIPQWLQIIAAVITILEGFRRVQSRLEDENVDKWLQSAILLLLLITAVVTVIQFDNFVSPDTGNNPNTIGPTNESNGGDGAGKTGNRTSKTGPFSDGLFEILSTTDDSTLTFRFVVDGKVSEAETDGNQADIGSGGKWEDTIRDNGDGTVTVTGKTGNHEGDVFQIDGQLVEFERTGGDSGMRLEFDNELVTNSLVDDPTSYNRTFEILSTSADETFTYQFVVDGEAYEASADDNGADLHTDTEWEDTIRDNGDGTVTVAGKEGLREGDVFLINGEIERFWKTGKSGMLLELDDRNVTGEFLDGQNTARRLLLYRANRGKEVGQRGFEPRTSRLSAERST